ncbi:MAG TPA: CopG family transcriptional regulator [Vicinamibacterales bacterium]|nr:CopG family transcriptional regulator [Vicinamibacterales bacterium]
MALSRKKATTIALDPKDDRLLSRAARDRGISRSEFIRQHLALVLEQYRRHPKPRSAGSVGELRERGDERELFGAGR